MSIVKRLVQKRDNNVYISKKELELWEYYIQKLKELNKIAAAKSYPQC